MFSTTSESATTEGFSRINGQTSKPYTSTLIPEPEESEEEAEYQLPQWVTNPRPKTKQKAVEGEIITDQDCEAPILDEKSVPEMRRRGSGRRTKLTPRLFKRMRTLLQAGVPRMVACANCNISTKTFYKWLQEGEKDAEEGEESRERDFFEMTEVAESDAVVAAATIIKSQMVRLKDPRLALEFLTRRFPQDWGRKNIEINGPNGGPLELDISEDAKRASAQLASLDSIFQAARLRSTGISNEGESAGTLALPEPEREEPGI